MFSPLYGQMRDRQEGDEIVILQGVLPNINTHDRFMTSFDPAKTDADIVTIHDGTVAYKVLGYARDIAEGQNRMFGRSF
jgi:hypothetical protein